MSHNPNAPTIVGPEWLPWRWVPGGVSLPAAAYINSSASETIDKVMIPYMSTGVNYSYGRLWCEIYNVADLGVNETPSSTVFVPNQDVASNAVYYTTTGGSEVGPVSGTGNNLNTLLDDLAGVETWWSRDIVTVASVPINNVVSSARFAFNTNGGTLPAGRVLSVELQVTYLEYGAVHWSTFAVDLYNNTTQVARLMTVTPHDNTSIAGKLATAGTVMQQNPLTGEPWTRDEVLSFDTGTNLLLQIVGVTGSNHAGLDAPIGSSICSMRLVVSMISEKRVAIGGNTASDIPWNVEPYSSNTANFCQLRTPTGTDNWAKASGTDYLVVMRALSDPTGVHPRQTFTFNYVESGVANPHDQGHVYNIHLDNFGRITEAGPYGLRGAAMGVIIVNTSNALSVDSLVYWNVFTSLVSTGRAVSTQRISNHATTNYAQVRAIVGVGNAGSPNQPLLFKIKRVSDNVQIGGTGTLNFADLSQHTLKGTTRSDSPLVGETITWYDVTVTLASVAALVSGTQYYIELSSTAFDTTSWRAIGIGYAHSYTATGDQSYGNNTDYGTFDGGSGSGNSDLAVVAITSPPAGPASLTVTTSNIALPSNGDNKCLPGVHASSHLAWTATSEGVLFSFYEIQRSENGGTSWTTIARLTPESTTSFDDVEAARGIALQYRIRTVRLSGQVSTWRTQTGTTTLAYNTTAVIFATNDDRALTVGYVPLGTDRKYDFLGDADVNVVQFHGRDLQVLFRSTEDRGARRAYTLLIYSKTVHSDPDPPKVAAAAFDALRAVIEDPDAPYTTVFTPDGERIFAGVRLPSGLRIVEAEHYTTTVSIVPVASEIVAV